MSFSGNNRNSNALNKCTSQCAKIGNCYIACSATMCPFEACDPCYCMGEGEAPPPELIGKYTENVGNSAHGSNQSIAKPSGMKGQASFEIHANGLISYKHYHCYHYHGGPCGSTRYRVKVKGWNNQRMGSQGGNVATTELPGFVASQEVEGTILCCFKRPFRIDQTNSTSTPNMVDVTRFVPWRFYNSEKGFFVKEQGGESTNPVAAAGGGADSVAVAEKVEQEDSSASTPAAADNNGAPMDVEMER